MGAILGVFACVFGAMWVGTTSTSGQFNYSLDDPYIHLTLARTIMRGGYGINLEWPSSPSSSIAWPFLLAPFTPTPFAEWAPLVINLLATLGTVAILYCGMRFFAGPWLSAALIGTASVLANIVGVAFTGMEHSVQVLLAALTTHGVLIVIREGRMPRWLVPVLILGPLLRYENAAVSLVAAAVIFWSGRRRVAVLTTIAWGALLLAFSFWLTRLGLSPLPSSVLAKNNFNGGTTAALIPVIVVGRLVVAAKSLPLWLVLGATGTDMIRRRSITRLHAYVLGVAALHVAGGQFGWFGRYELYMIAATLVPVLGWLLATFSGRRWRLPVVFGLVLVAYAQLFTITILSPGAAREIGLQQAQTANFVAVYWRRPIAVNDLGLVSWRGGQVTLDLWGLGDQEARQLRPANPPDWMDTLVKKHDIHLIAVYRKWFPHSIPASWITVATYTSPHGVITDDATVEYFVPAPADKAAACEALSAWAPHVPAQATLTLYCTG